MTTIIPESFIDTVVPMREAHADILAVLHREGLSFADYPALAEPGRPQGMAAAIAYPMQGILKYHGMSDWDWRIAYLPSVSVCNDAAYSLTRVEFDPDFAEDSAIIGGAPARGRDLERVRQSLDAVRRIARVNSYARVVSRNVVRGSKTGKGLGSSASGSAALATAALAALFGPEIVQNRRLLSCMSRLLAGSGCRSATGGVSLWLSYPGISHEESFAVRLDDAGQLDDLRLVTVPIDSRIGLKTELAHHDAPESSFFKSWMLSRGPEVLECIAAARTGDWQTLGRWAELDSMRLHGVTMSGSRENKLFAWEPENIALFRMCNDLRAAGAPVYCSTDTGPTAVFLTHKDHEASLVAAIHDLKMGFEVIQGRAAGPAELVDLERAALELDHIS